MLWTEPECTYGLETGQQHEDACEVRVPASTAVSVAQIPKPCACQVLSDAGVDGM